jgi:hypothetical protein
VRSGQTTSFLLAEFVKALGMFAHFLVCARVTGVGLVIFVRALGLDIVGQDFSAPAAAVRFCCRRLDLSLSDCVCIIAGESRYCSLAARSRAQAFHVIVVFS